MRPLLGVLTGVVTAVAGAYGLFLSPASEYFFPALLVAALAGALVSLVSGRRLPQRDQRRSLVVWFPLGVTLGCALAVVGLLGTVIYLLDPA